MKILWSLAMLSIIISSCSYVNQKTLPPENKTAGTENSKKDRDVVLKRRIAALIREKNFDKALDLIDVALKLGASEQTYGRECIDSINGLIEMGISSFSWDDYENAGISFGKVIDHYPSDGNIRAEISHSSKQIGSLIKTCEDKLMENGLSEYRKGNLGNAISTWNKILKFNKEHEKAKRMIATTSIQLKKLEMIK